MVKSGRGKLIGKLPRQSNGWDEFPSTRRAAPYNGGLPCAFNSIQSWNLLRAIEYGRGGQESGRLKLADDQEASENASDSCTAWQKVGRSAFEDYGFFPARS